MLGRSEYSFLAAQWYQGCSTVGRLTKKSSHLLSDREIFILESLRPEGRKSKSTCGGRGSAQSLCLPLGALKKMTVACVDIRQKFKYAAYGKENKEFCSYIQDGQVVRKGCLVYNVCYI